MQQRVFDTDSHNRLLVTRFPRRIGQKLEWEAQPAQPNNHPGVGSTAGDIGRNYLLV